MKTRTLIISICIILIGTPALVFYLSSPVFWSAVENTSGGANTRIIAHRGFHNDFPENSIEAVKAAIEAGIKEIEIDVHQTADQQLVVIHDFILSALTGLNGRVRNISWTDLKKYNENSTAPVARLDSILSVVDGRVKLLIELKAGNSYYPRIEKNLVELIGKYDAVAWTAVHSFSDEVLENLHRTEPDLELHKLLIAYCASTNLMIDEGIHFASLDQYNHVSCISVNYAFATTELIRNVHERGKRLNVWNLNDRNIAGTLRTAGVDGIISDEPLELIRTLN